MIRLMAALISYLNSSAANTPAPGIHPGLNEEASLLLRRKH